MSRASLRRRRRLMGSALANPISALLLLAEGWFDMRYLTSHTADEIPNQAATGTSKLYNGTGTGADAEDTILAAYLGEKFAVFRPGRESDSSVYGGVVPITATTTMTVEYDFGVGGPPLNNGTFSPGGVCVSTGYGAMMYFYADGRTRLWANGTTYNHISNVLTEPLWHGYRYVRGTATTGVGSTIEARNSTLDPWTLISSKMDMTFTHTTGTSCVARVGCVPYNVGSNSYDGQLYSMKFIEDGVTTYEFNPDRDIDGDPTLWDDANGTTTWEVLRSGTEDHEVLIATDAFATMDGYRLTADLTPTVTASTGKTTAVVVFRKDGDTTTDYLLNSGTGAGNRGLSLVLSSGNAPWASLYDDTSTGGYIASATSTFADGAIHTAASILDDGDLRVWNEIDGFSIDEDVSGLGTVTFTPWEVGVNAVGNQITTAEILGVFFFPGEALDNDQLSAIHSSYV